MVAISSHLRAELEELPHESVGSAGQRELATFDRAVSVFGNRIVLFGAGNLGRKVLTLLRREIAKARGDYALFLRPFVPESWNLVCYAIPKTRLLP